MRSLRGGVMPALALLLFLLAACAEPAATVPPTATLPAPTATLEPTSIPTDTPSPTATLETSEPIRLKVLFAGSLIIPLDAVEAAFEAEHPEIDVEMEGHGSIQVIRHITELGDLVDVALLADYSLVPGMMYQQMIPDTDTPFADWTIEFAGNEMVLAYTDDSLYADEIDESNWYQILAREDTRKGLSDPRFDASGYRALMVLQLAENLYQKTTILENVLMGRFTHAITSEEADGMVVIHVPELLQPKDDADVLLRSYSVQLIALLQAGEIDYAFAYKTVAQQHDLPFVELPAEINLGSPEHEADYHQVEVQLDFQRFATVAPRFAGQTIKYGVTIPNNAVHPDAAELFVAFLLGPQGQAVMADSGHPLLAAYHTDSPDSTPATLKDMTTP